MFTSTHLGILSVLAALVYPLFALGLYVAVTRFGQDEFVDELLSTGHRVFNLLFIVLLGPVLFLLWLAWEVTHRRDANTPGWRSGTLVKTALSCVVVVAFSMLVLSRSYPNFTWEDLPILAALPLSTTLLLPVTLVPPLFVATFYTLTLQFYIR